MPALSDTTVLSAVAQSSVFPAESHPAAAPQLAVSAVTLFAAAPLLAQSAAVQCAVALPTLAIPVESLLAVAALQRDVASHAVLPLAAAVLQRSAVPHVIPPLAAAVLQDAATHVTFHLAAALLHASQH